MNAVLIAASVMVAVLVGMPAAAHDYEKGDIRVRHPWTRATPPGAAVAAGYLEIRNSGGKPDRLVGASTPVAERVELHLTEREGDVMKMREIPHLEVPARKRVTLRPAGTHLMIIGLKKPLARGEQVPLSLRFERAGELQVMLEVQAADSSKSHH